MQALNLPTYSFNIKSEGERKFILDVIRRKYVFLTPEEWVRQNFIQYLAEEKQFPLSLMSIEKGFALNKLKRRYDILIYNRLALPFVLVECKAPDVKINNLTFDQIIRYNLSYKVKFLIVTNGLQHFCCKLNFEQNSHDFLKEIPDFNTLIEG
jgi:Type I restriction enzyme R protein N terminus (HSDR_N)